MRYRRSKTTFDTINEAVWARHVIETLYLALVRERAWSYRQSMLLWSPPSVMRNGRIGYLALSSPTSAGHLCPCRHLRPRRWRLHRTVRSSRPDCWRLNGRWLLPMEVWLGSLTTATAHLRVGHTIPVQVCADRPCGCERRE